MNEPEVRPIDYDDCRERAHALRRQAIDRAIDFALDWIRAALSARPVAPKQPAGAPSAHCPA